MVTKLLVVSIRRKGSDFVCYAVVSENTKFVNIYSEKEREQVDYYLSQKDEVFLIEDELFDYISGLDLRQRVVFRLEEESEGVVGRVPGDLLGI